MKEFNRKLWQKRSREESSWHPYLCRVKNKVLFFFSPSITTPHFGLNEALKLEVSLLLVQYFLGEKYSKGL